MVFRLPCTVSRDQLCFVGCFASETWLPSPSRGVAEFLHCKRTCADARMIGTRVASRHNKHQNCSGQHGIQHNVSRLTQERCGRSSWFWRISDKLILQGGVRARTCTLKERATTVDRSACTTGPRCTRGQSTQPPCIFSGFLKTIKIKFSKILLEKNSTLNSVSENVKVFPAPTLTKDPRQTITHIPQISSICRKRWTVLFIHKTTPFLPEVNLWQQAMQGEHPLTTCVHAMVAAPRHTASYITPFHSFL